MKVFAYIKIHQHPTKDYKGDIIYLYPTTEFQQHQGNLTLNDHLPVLIEANIPCDEGMGLPKGYGAFNKVEQDCGKCTNNDPTLCDKIKYQRAVFSGGSLFEEPIIINKRMYYIDVDDFLSVDSKASIAIANKTKEKMGAILTTAIKPSNIIPISIIKDRTVVIKEVIK